MSNSVEIKNLYSNTIYYYSFFDYVPAASTVKSLVEIFQSRCCAPKEPEKITHYYRYLNDNSFVRRITLIFPLFGNLIIALFDLYNYVKGQSLHRNAMELIAQKKTAEAVDILKEAAEKYSHVESMYQLGSCYNLGEEIDEEPEEAFKWYKKAAEKGHVIAAFDSGECCDKGYGTEKNMAAAKELYEYAASKNYAPAMNSLGVYYQDEKNDQKKAIELFKKASELDNINAMYNLAMYYLEADPINWDEAVRLLSKAAEMGDGESWYALGECHLDTRWCHQSYHEAVCCFAEARNQGYMKGSYGLGLCYSQGYGVEKDLNLANQYFKEAEQANC